jgi:hypothetical protein
MTQAAQREGPAPFKIATLVRGNSYTLRGKVFLNGQAQPIDEPTYAWLSEKAIDRVTVHDGARRVPEIRHKFRFVDPEAATRASPRKRSR